ncbi:MAG: LysE family translocator [Demequinaceae bacterium]|nr:LysE family translocator [Demequinaceae bacterium]
MSTAFLLTTLVVVVAPGAGVIYTVSTGLSRGSRAGIVAAFGCTMGIVPHMVAAITGAAAILHASALAFQTFKWLGVAYLLYLAWQIWRDRSDLEAAGTSTLGSVAKVIREAVLLNLLNPKLTVFFFAFLPQFVDGSRPGYIWQMLALSGVFMLATFVVFVLYGVFAGAVRTHVITRPRAVRRMRLTFAATYVAIAGRLAVSAR